MPVTTQSSVLEAERRAWLDWFADGLPNLVVGTGFLALGLFLHFDRHSAGLLGAVATLLSLGLYLFNLIRQKQIIEWLKAKVTYPRTGYAALPHLREEETAAVDFISLNLNESDAKGPEAVLPPRKDLKDRVVLGVVISLAVAAVLAIMLIDNPWICVLASIMWAVAFWLGSRERGRVSWLILIGLILVGAIMTASATERKDRFAYFMAAMGLLLLLDGLIALIRYIQRNPVAQS